MANQNNSHSSADSSITAAARTGDRRRTLKAMRDKLAADMDEAAPAVVAQIAGRLSAVLVELEQLGVAKKVTTLDELDQRRKDRLSTSNDSSSTRGSTRQRRPRSG